MYLYVSEMKWQHLSCFHSLIFEILFTVFIKLFAFLESFIELGKIIEHD